MKFLKLGLASVIASSALFAGTYNVDASHSNAAVAKIESKPRGYYFNLAIEIKTQRKNTTAWTAHEAS